MELKEMQFIEKLKLTKQKENQVLALEKQIKNSG
jgi:hypothetical protein